MSVKEAAREYPFSEAALRALFQRSRPHYDHKGELVAGNGLAGAFCQPRGKNGRVIIDTLAFDRWLLRWTGAEDCGARGGQPPSDS
jgi:hypothetical protein